MNEAFKKKLNDLSIKRVLLIIVCVFVSCILISCGGNNITVPTPTATQAAGGNSTSGYVYIPEDGSDNILYLTLPNPPAGYAPAPNATVQIPELNITVTTDNQGKFSMEGVPQGEYRAIISYPSLTPVNIPLILAPPESTITYNKENATISILPNKAILRKGEIRQFIVLGRDGSGTFFIPRSVTWSVKEGNIGNINKENGTFIAEMEGVGLVAASTSGGLTATAVVEVKTLTGELKGSVVDTSYKGVAEAEVTITGYNRVSITDQEGRYYFSSVPAETELLVNVRKDNFIIGSASVSIQPNKTTVLNILANIPGAESTPTPTATPVIYSIQGKVKSLSINPDGSYNEVASIPIERAKVSTWEDGGKNLTYTDPEGNFTLNVPEGRWHIKVESDGFIRSLTYEMKISQNMQDLNIPMLTYLSFSNQFRGYIPKVADEDQSLTFGFVLSIGTSLDPLMELINKISNDLENEIYWQNLLDYLNNQVATIDGVKIEIGKNVYNTENEIIKNDFIFDPKSMMRVLSNVVKYPVILDISETTRKGFFILKLPLYKEKVNLYEIKAVKKGYVFVPAISFGEGGQIKYLEEGGKIPIYSIASPPVINIIFFIRQ